MEKKRKINYRALRWASIIGFVFYIVGAFCVYPLSKDLAISMGFVGLAADM